MLWLRLGGMKEHVSCPPAHKASPRPGALAGTLPGLFATHTGPFLSPHACTAPSNVQSLSRAEPVDPNRSALQNSLFYQCTTLEVGGCCPG